MRVDQRLERRKFRPLGLQFDNETRSTRGARPDLNEAAETVHALAHEPQAEALRTLETRPVVGDLEHHTLVNQGDRQRTLGGVSVRDDVGDGLLGDKDDHLLDRTGQLFDFLIDGDVNLGDPRDLRVGGKLFQCGPSAELVEEWWSQRPPQVLQARDQLLLVAP